MTRLATLTVCLTGLFGFDFLGHSASAGELRHFSPPNEPAVVAEARNSDPARLRNRLRWNLPEAQELRVARQPETPSRDPRPRNEVESPSLAGPQLGSARADQRQPAGDRREESAAQAGPILMLGPARPAEPRTAEVQQHEVAGTSRASDLPLEPDSADTSVAQRDTPSRMLLHAPSQIRTDAPSAAPSAATGLQPTGDGPRGAETELSEQGVRREIADSTDSTDVAIEQLSPEVLELRDTVRRCLAFYYHRPSDTSQYSPWGIMHAALAHEVDSEVLVGGRRVNALGWLCYNGPCRGMRMLATRGQEITVRQGPGFQGHQAQFLAVLAKCRVPRDYPLRVDGREFTVQDLVEHEKLECRPRTELTFTLIGLVHYLDSEAQWRSRWGQPWNIERLIQEELAQPINGAACGGTHRMMGLSYAVRKREQRNEPMTGQWYRAKRFVDDYLDYTFGLQNHDGSFSTNWFVGRGSDPSIDRRVQTTGHILEWLAFAIPEDQLFDPRVMRAVDYLATTMRQHGNRNWEIGPKGHALRALTIYDQRAFGAQPGERYLASVAE